MDTVRAAVALITDKPVAESDHLAAASVLLVQRQAHPHDPWSGHWALPGGRIEATDPNSRFTSQRESQEECGFLNGDLFGGLALPVALAGRAVGASLPVAPYYWHCGGEQPQLTLQQAEIARAWWMPLQHFLTISKHYLAHLAPRLMQPLPYIMCLDTPLWGFTYGVLRDWVVSLGVALPLPATVQEVPSRD